jgi:Putative peptidoglycan binding domain
MALTNSTLTGSTRLEGILAGGAPMRRDIPERDIEDIKKIQRALQKLTGPMPKSFPTRLGGEPDGIFGNETFERIVRFQQKAFPLDSREWDGRIGKKTLQAMDDELNKGAAPVPPPAKEFICGPDVTKQVEDTWTQIQKDFKTWTREQKLKACMRILIPIQKPGEDAKLEIPTDLEELKQQIRQFADINGWDTLPLFQGASWWLRHPPIFDAATNGPCATPSSASPDASDFDPMHELDSHCANTVQVQGVCWLNGTVNYGMFGVMVKLCSDFARDDFFVSKIPGVRIVFSLDWAKMLIKAYKRFGNNPEAAQLPVAWTEATFNGGPSAVPDSKKFPGNRPKCQCKCGCKGDVVNWDYVWEPMRHRPDGKLSGGNVAKMPEVKSP